jgi:ribosomal protein L40E
MHAALEPPSVRAGLLWRLRDAGDIVASNRDRVRPMTTNDGDLDCPQCGHSNPPKADYCWECRYDFVHDERLKAAPRPAAPTSARKIPPPYSTPRPQARSGEPREHISAFAFAMELMVSTVIVGGSWLLASAVWPDMHAGIFVAGWAIALTMVKISEGVLPDPETDLSEYYSWNPFQYRDDMNRKVLSAHISLFLPRVVLHTIRRGFRFIFAR